MTTILFVCAASDAAVLNSHLLKSDCIRTEKHPCVIHWNASSAAEAFNFAADGATGTHAEWVVWVHQDVYLPPGWAQDLLTGIATAEQIFRKLSVVGVYGITVDDQGHARRAGQVLDRGHALMEPARTPCIAEGIDELAFAVRVNSGLRLDPDLRFDFYGTDLVLQAKAKGLDAAIVTAYCEHHSTTPIQPPVPQALCDRIRHSGHVLENKWRTSLPLHTPLLTIRKLGDIDRFVSGYTPGSSHAP